MGILVILTFIYLFYIFIIRPLFRMLMCDVGDIWIYNTMDNDPFKPGVFIKQYKILRIKDGHIEVEYYEVRVDENLDAHHEWNNKSTFSKWVFFMVLVVLNFKKI